MLIASPTCATYRPVALIESKLKNKKKFKYCQDLRTGDIKICIIISIKYFQFKVMLYIFPFFNLYLMFYFTRYCQRANIIYSVIHAILMSVALFFFISSFLCLFE